jgi:hypothetical protein
MTLADAIERRLRAIPGIGTRLTTAAVRRVALEAAEVAREYVEMKQRPSVWCALHGVWNCWQCERR